MGRNQLENAVASLRSMVAAPAAKDQTDRELIRAFLSNNDQVAFAALVKRYGPLVFGVCKRRLPHHEDVEDSFQAVFIVLAKHAAALSKRTSLAGWLHRVSHRIALNCRRAGLRRGRYESEARTMAPPSPERQAVWNEIQAILDEEIQRLPDKYREPFLLCHMQNLSCARAARQLGIKEGTIWSRLSQARMRLQNRLTRRGIAPTIAAGAITIVASQASATLPAGLAAAAAKAGLAWKTGAFATGVVSEKVAALVHGDTATLLVTKVKLAAVFFLGFGAIVGAAGLYGSTDGLRARQAAREEANPVVAQKPALPRQDVYGDPLPEGAVARLGTSRFFYGDRGHTQVLYTPDGDKILAAGWSGAFLLDAVTGRHLRQWHVGDRQAVDSMSVTSDGKGMALGVDGFHRFPSSIQIWDLTTGQLSREIQTDGNKRPWHARIAPNGKLVAAFLDKPHTIYIWDVATGKVIRQWPAEAEILGCLTFSHDAKTLIAGECKNIHFWDIATGQELMQIHDHPGDNLHRLVLSPDGKALASQAGVWKSDGGGKSFHRDSKINLWNVATGKKTGYIQLVPETTTKLAKWRSNPAEVDYFQYSPGGSTLATTGGDAILRLWDPVSGKEIRRWDTKGFVGKFDFSPDGKTLVSMGGGNVLRRWDTATGMELAEHPSHSDGFTAVAISPDGKSAATLGEEPGIRLWDLATGKPLGVISFGPISQPVLSGLEDVGPTLTTKGDDGRPYYWAFERGQELRQLSVPTTTDAITKLSLSPDGKALAIVGENPDSLNCKITIWDTAKQRTLHTIVGNGLRGGPTFSDDGRTLFCLSANFQVQAWDIASGKKLREFATVSGLGSPRFSLDGNWCVGAEQGDQDKIVLYEMETGQKAPNFEFADLRTHYNLPSLAFSPDSRMLAIGDDIGTILIVELASGKTRKRMVGGHRGAIRTLVFSADSKRLVSGSSDTTALVWDLCSYPETNSKSKSLSSADFNKYWNDLASQDARTAHYALCRLADAADEAIPLMRELMHPTLEPDPRVVASWIAELDSAKFAQREKAYNELEKVGEGAARFYREALVRHPSPEVRRHLERLIEKLKQGNRNLSPTYLQIERANEVLELAASPDARKFLENLAAGAPEARLTQYAKASLQRLGRRQAK